MSDAPNADGGRTLSARHGVRHDGSFVVKGGGVGAILCGCGWVSRDHSSPAETSGEHDIHRQAERRWRALTEAQRVALDVMVAVPSAEWVSGSTVRASSSGSRARRTALNATAALHLAKLGLAAADWSGAYRFQVTESGRAVHPLFRCSAERGGRLCGYCHRCARRLPNPAMGWCPGCGSNDEDE